MHAVIVKVRIKDEEQARGMLAERVVPMVSGSPGFVSGVWLAPEDGKGGSVAVFDSEENARAMADQVEAPPESPVEIVSVEVRGVAATA